VLRENIIKFLNLDGIIGNLTGYVETKVELMKLELKEDLAKALSKVAVYALLTFAFTFFMFFLSIAAAYAISESMGSFAGFAIVAAFYLLLAVIIYLLRKTLDNGIEKKLKDILKQHKK
jgi:uncharacterized membrane protein YqjE